jgi:hypothetical protein
MATQESNLFQSPLNTDNPIIKASPSSRRFLQDGYTQRHFDREVNFLGLIAEICLMVFALLGAELGIEGIEIEFSEVSVVHSLFFERL